MKHQPQLCLSHTPELKTRQIATQVGITERAAQRILAILVSAGIVSVGKERRRNHYELKPDLKLRHLLESHKTIGEFINLIDNEVQADKRADLAFTMRQIFRKPVRL